MGVVTRQPPTNTKTKLDLTKLLGAFHKALCYFVFLLQIYVFLSISTLYNC